MNRFFAHTLAVAALALLLVAATFVTAEPDADLITGLPGYSEPLNFRQFSGYVTVNEDHGRNLFYWFTESQNDPANDPLVLWLNGGPGCSSLGGLLGEHGPLIVAKDGKSLYKNPYAWNRVANVIYLESPAGVGFSYSKDRSDYTVGDVRTANDTLTFLLKFLTMFPQYAASPFYISGESYAGHYVPNAAKRVLDYNDQSSQPINLQGFLVGNPWTDAYIDNFGAAFYWWTHAINSYETFDAMAKNCDFAHIGPLFKQEAPRQAAALLKQQQSGKSSSNDACSDATDRSTAEMGNINIYEIYEDACLRSRHTDARQLLRTLQDHPNRGLPLHHLGKKFATDVDLDPCLDDHVNTYVNQPEVITAIHAIKYDIKQWLQCSIRVNYSYTDLLASMLPVYEYLFTKNIRMLVYSGDVDGIVPYTGTRAWVEKLPVTVRQSFQPWIGSDNQVAGYTVHYDQMTLATVRGAGHMVPYTQPMRAFDLFSRFLDGSF